MDTRKTYIEACGKCFYKSKCKGIYKKYVEYFGDKEFKPIEANPASEYKFQNFFFWVFATNQCNRNCEYCKQGDPISKHNYMTEENLRYVLDECVKIHNNKPVDRISFEVSGGEPFLAFDTFSKIIPEYKKKSPFFRFSSATNGTIIDNRIIRYIKEVYNGSICMSVDDLVFSKPLNGISSSALQLKNIKRLKEAGIKISCISVFDSRESMMPIAEYAVENFCHWRILLVKPVKHTKEQILTMAKPVLKFLFGKQLHTATFFDFDGWDLWNRKNRAGCPCGRRLLGILPDLEILPNNGENNPPRLGKFNADIISRLDNPANYYYKNDCRPAVCSDCALKNECDGGCRSCHPYADNLKERCAALKELMDYAWRLDR
jgi:sulfatase maturation enzyme AslB (radical SAM superfamily)